MFVCPDVLTWFSYTMKSSFLAEYNGLSFQKKAFEETLFSAGKIFLVISIFLKINLT